MAVEPKLMTIDEFEAFIAQPENKDRLFELIQGEIVEKMPTEEHATIAATLTIKIGIYIEQKSLGGRVTVEARHRMPGDDQNARLPDVAYTSAERMQPIVKKGPVPQMPDLAVEIQSPDDSLKGLREEAAYYLANGARMVWLVLPAQQLVEVWTPDEQNILMPEDTLDGGAVLPGFTLAVKDIFPT